MRWSEPKNAPQSRLRSASDGRQSHIRLTAKGSKTFAAIDHTWQGATEELLAPLSDESTIARFLDRSGPGIQQLAYRVADIDAACAALREKGVRLLYDAPRRGTADSRINFVHPRDAGGILVELVEPAAAGAH